METVERRARVPVAKEGWPFILTPVALALILALAECIWLALFFFALASFVTYFFRDPERSFTSEEGAIVCPADGKIIKVDRVDSSPLSGRPSTRISIFMSVFDVHVNRAPTAGQVAELRYVPGSFFNASLDKASEKNERLHLALTGDNERRLELTQVAGLIARRIVCWARPGDRLEAGERFGLIRFGSRVDLYLDPETELRINRGQRVKAGQTVIGRLT